MEPIEIDVLFQKPVPIRIRWEDGSTEIIELPRLGTDGLLPWLDELTKERIEAGRLVITQAKLTAIDRTRAEKTNLLDRAILSDLSPLVQHPPGIKRVLQLSLGMTDMPAEKQALVLKHLMATAHVASNLAQVVSTLFYTGEKRETPKEPDHKEPANPLSPLPDGSSDTSAPGTTSTPS